MPNADAQRCFSIDAACGRTQVLLLCCVPPVSLPCPLHQPHLLFQGKVLARTCFTRNSREVDQIGMGWYENACTSWRLFAPSIGTVSWGFAGLPGSWLHQIIVSSTLHYSIPMPMIMPWNTWNPIKNIKHLIWNFHEFRGANTLAHDCRGVKHCKRSSKWSYRLKGLQWPLHTTSSCLPFV